MSTKLLLVALMLFCIQLAICSHQMAPMPGGDGAMDTDHLRGMTDEEMRAWQSHKFLRAESKGKKGNKNGTEEATKEGKQPGLAADDGENDDDENEIESKSGKCVENADCLSDAQCGKKSKCQLLGLERKKKAGTCDCGYCGTRIQFGLSPCGLQDGLVSVDKSVPLYECGGLKGACIQNPLIPAIKSKQCNCEAGFKAAGYKSMREGQKELCNKQKCDGKKDTCLGMKCSIGKCRCHLTDL